MACDEGVTFGGYAGATETHSPGLGTWERTGGKSFRATRLMLVFDKATGVLLGITRSRFDFHFAGDFSRIEGLLWMEYLACPSPFACPDPIDPNAAWLPISPQQGLPGKALRVPLVPAGPLQ